MGHISNFIKYWRNTKSTLEWKVAYRETNNSSFLDDRTVDFQLVDTPEGTWAADPFLYKSLDGHIYLFYELFINNQNKGVIAFSKYDGTRFSSPTIAIEEKFHLSFPCIFDYKDNIYMIPESGADKAIKLYRCVHFPEKWSMEKVLLNNINSSDTIVWDNGIDLYCIASILEGSASKARNDIYKFDNNMDLVPLSKGDYASEDGIRNAGLILNKNNQHLRPGQYCPNGQYGKGLVFWNAGGLLNDNFAESKMFTVLTSEMNSEISDKYDGIHTYNSIEEMECVDLRYIKKNSVSRRLVLMKNIVMKYFDRKGRLA